MQPVYGCVTLGGQVELLIVARHAESAYNVQALISADPSSHRSPLTSGGIQQARSLADRLAGDEIDLCVASGTLRAVQTAEIVGTALSIPLMKTPLLDDPPAGVFEDGPVEDFVRWMSGFTLLGTVDDWDGRIVTENHWVIDPAERLARA